MLYPPGFYYVKKPKRFVILSSDKSSERNLSCFFDIKKPSRIEHLQSEEPLSSDPYFKKATKNIYCTRAIISRGLYIFYPISKGHFFVFKEVFSRAASNQERLTVGQIWQKCKETSNVMWFHWVIFAWNNSNLSNSFLQYFFQS